MKISQSPTMPSMGQGGRSPNSPAQLARLAGAEAPKTKSAVPRSGPGLPAGRVAKGADPASVLAAQIAAGPPRVSAQDAWGDGLAHPGRPR